MDEQVYRSLLDDAAVDVCFGMHRLITVEGITLEELYDVEPIEEPVEAPMVEQDTVFVICLYCKREVHASRYTNHLEKCMTGSRRMVTPKQRQDAARETERRQLQTLNKPQLAEARVS